MLFSLWKGWRERLRVAITTKSNNRVFGFVQRVTFSGVTLLVEVDAGFHHVTVPWGRIDLLDLELR